MKLQTIKWIGYSLTWAVFVFGFILFFQQTNEWVGSLFAALCSAALVFGMFVVFYWIAMSIKK